MLINQNDRTTRKKENPKEVLATTGPVVGRLAHLDVFAVRNITWRWT